MQSLFAHEFRGGGDAERIIEYTAREFSDRLKDLKFCHILLASILEKREDIVKIIQTEAPEWPIEKIAPIDRAVLEMGIYEIIYSSDVPPIVAINEAVEIAKNYGDTNSPKFINGVLSTVMHKYKNQTVK